MIYIDNGKTVKEYYTHPRIDKAVQTLLEKIEDLFYAETFEGMKVAIIERSGEHEDRN